MSSREATEQLWKNLRALEASLNALPERDYLARGQRWSPRDIVAHLIGWNRAVIRGSQQLLRGELPIYDEDPGEDYSNVNAHFLDQYSCEDRKALLVELNASAKELESFLQRISAADWVRDSGVEHDGERLSIRATVLELVTDYDHHARQLETWTLQGDE